MHFKFMVLTKAIFSFRFLVVVILSLFLTACKEEGISCSITVSWDEDGTIPIDNGAFLTDREPAPFWVHTVVNNDGSLLLPQTSGPNILVTTTVTDYGNDIKKIKTKEKISAPGSLTVHPILIHSDSLHDSVIKIKVNVSAFSGEEMDDSKKDSVDLNQVGAAQVEIVSDSTNNSADSGNIDLNIGDISTMYASCSFKFEVHSIR